MTVASDEQVKLATSKSNEVKVGYRKVWIYDDSLLTAVQRDDILRQLRDQLAKQQSVKVNSGPKPLPPYQQSQQQIAATPTHQQHQQPGQLQAQLPNVEQFNTTPDEGMSGRGRYQYVRHHSISLANPTPIAYHQQQMNIQHQLQANNQLVGQAVGQIPTLEITPDNGKGNKCKNQNP